MTRILRQLLAKPATASLAASCLLLLPALAEARPGGGQGYSGGGGSGGGGGGGDGGGLIFLLIRLLIWLIFNHPVIGIPLTICVIVAFVRWNKNNGKRQMGWDSMPTRATPPPQRQPAQDLEAIRTLDPDFSIVLFDDFVFALYARAHQARANKRDLDALAPYLSESARAGLAQRQPAGTPVTAVVVGALRVLDVRLPGPPAGPTPDSRVCVTLEIESNLTLGAAGREITQYVKERWRLARGANVRTKPPQQVQSFHCPNCGAPFEPTGSDRCQYCGEAVSNGRFDWTVETIDGVRAEARPPALTGTVQEVGTDWPTIFHPALPARRADLLRDDPTATDEALAARLRLIYDDLNKSWTNLDLTPVRPYVSDGLFDYLQYWIAAYKSQGLRNVLEGMRMTEVTLTKIVRDRWYDALTYRIWGTGRDSTIRVATGEVVGGNPGTDRAYSEYWTLIRGAGVRGAPHTDKTCPNCGAALDTNMAGECAHCGAKITSGEFDWVLSKIEQDDSYTG
ncbi:MAG TPA: TIM44-like domain-containing protein [Thermoanaerobaculia bacterium]|nr:TIM44-like domain-containing protein [Thermoanaerobaculia bacterium]